MAAEEAPAAASRSGDSAGESGDGRQFCGCDERRPGSGPPSEKTQANRPARTGSAS